MAHLCINLLASDIKEGYKKYTKMEQLTDKQEMFCHEYLIDLNGTQAYVRAFQSENRASARTEASRLLSNPNVRTRIKELMKVRSENLLIDAGYVVESLISIAEKCQVAQPVLEWDDNSHSFVETGEYKFDSVGANRSLELLGKHLGVFEKDNSQKAVNVASLIITPADGSAMPLNTSESDIDRDKDERYSQ